MFKISFTFLLHNEQIKRHQNHTIESLIHIHTYTDTHICLFRASRTLGQRLSKLDGKKRKQNTRQPTKYSKLNTGEHAHCYVVGIQMVSKHFYVLNRWQTRLQKSFTTKRALRLLRSHYIRLSESLHAKSQCTHVKQIILCHENIPLPLRIMLTVEYDTTFGKNLNFAFVLVVGFGFEMYGFYY